MSVQTNYLTPRVIITGLVFIILAPLLPLLISGRWDWWQAWAFALISILGFVTSRALAGRRHPDLLAERARMLQQEDAEPWDNLLAPLVGLGGALIPLTSGLQARIDWTPIFSLPAEILALLAVLAGYALGSYALIENRYFSGMVRLQTERGHKVVSSGPYRWVRHPGYAGALLTYLAAPVLLNTWWAFIPAVFLAIALVVRTYLEDRALMKWLDGYQQYASRVRYRLLPGVW